jgi:hypothetical protein
MRLIPRSIVCVAAATAALACLTVPARAQRDSTKIGASAPPAVVTGKVTGPDGKGLADVDVLLTDTLRVATDRRGEFEFDPVAPGEYSVIVRKIGYGPVRFRLSVHAGDIWDGTISMARAAQSMPEVVVLDSAKALRNFRPSWLDAFVDRRRVGLGKFLDRVDIEKARTPTTAKLLTAAGIVVHEDMGYDVLDVHRCGGGLGPRGKGIVFVDGMKIEESRTGRFLTFAQFPPETLAAIEIYTGRLTVPAAYDDPDACLIVLLWTNRR